MIFLPSIANANTNTTTLDASEPNTNPSPLIIPQMMITLLGLEVPQSLLKVGNISKPLKKMNT